MTAIPNSGGSSSPSVSKSAGGFTSLDENDRWKLTLTELANAFKSDKGTRTGLRPHRYAYLYDLLFWPLKRRPINLLEIGLAIGGPEVGGPIKRTVPSPSVQMWLAYFEYAHIFGFDISDFSHIASPRFTFVRGDAGSEVDLCQLVEAAPSFDLIIDDASHASYHQQLSLKVLFPKLAPGGIYVIEDLQWQSPAFESVLPKVPKTALFFTSFFEKGEYLANSLLSAEDMQALKAEVASFASFGAFDGSASPTKLIVMRKSAVQEGPVSTSTADSEAASDSSREDLITAAYMAVLERQPDPGGLLAYQNAFKGVSLRVGLERTLNALLRSKEGQSKALARIKQATSGTTGARSSPRSNKDRPC